MKRMNKQEREQVLRLLYAAKAGVLTKDELLSDPKAPGLIYISRDNGETYTIGAGKEAIPADDKRLKAKNAVLISIKYGLRGRTDQPIPLAFRETDIDMGDESGQSYPSSRLPHPEKPLQKEAPADSEEQKAADTSLPDKPKANNLYAPQQDTPQTPAKPPGHGHYAIGSSWDGKDSLADRVRDYLINT